MIVLELQPWKECASAWAGRSIAGSKISLVYALGPHHQMRQHSRLNTPPRHYVTKWMAVVGTHVVYAGIIYAPLGTAKHGGKEGGGKEGSGLWGPSKPLITECTHRHTRPRTLPSHTCALSVAPYVLPAASAKTVAYFWHVLTVQETSSASMKTLFEKEKKMSKNPDFQERKNIQMQRIIIMNIHRLNTLSAPAFHTTLG